MVWFRTVLVFVTLTQPAIADTFGVVETPAAFAVSDAQSDLFHPGVMPALGLYTGNDRGAIGIRARAGVLFDGPSPGAHFMDPSSGGLATGGIAFRFGTHAGWLEGVAGGGVTGHDFVPVVEAGAGWDFSVGSVGVGPSARYVHVVASSSERLGNADLVLVGIDVRFGARRAAAPRPAPVEAAPPPEPAFVPPTQELDGDHVADELPSCARDSDGCPILDDIVIIDDHIVLDERVFFDVNRAHVHARGRELIAALAILWGQHPDWDRMTIEGHADIRGTDDYNLDLSQRRADSVRAWFIRNGVEPARVDAIGYGRSRPRDPGDSEEAHARNRRVEFVVHRKGEP